MLIKGKSSRGRVEERRMLIGEIRKEDNVDMERLEKRIMLIWRSSR